MEKNYDKKQIREIVIYVLSVGIVFVLFLFLISVNIIGYSVKAECRLAQDKYLGDCVGALISYLDDDHNGFRERNSATWALGQLGDSRSLPVLKKYYTGFDGERCHRGQELSQLELKRAIGYMEGNVNITTFFWRFGQGID